MQLIFTLSTIKVWQLILAVSLLGSLNSLAQTDSWTLQPKSGINFPTAADFVFTIGNKAYSLDNSSYDNTTGYSKDFWEYDPETGAWSQKATFGGAGRTLESGFSIGVKGYVGLGVTGTNSRDITSDFWEYDLTSNSWSQKANVSSRARFAATGFAINGKGYFAGGFDWFSVFNNIVEYDPMNDKWTPIASVDTGFYGGISFTIGNKAYMGLGSKAVNTDKTTNQFYEFDPSANTVKRLTDFAGDKRVFAKSFGLKGKGYVTSTSNSLVNDFWQYDPITNNWLRKTDVPGKAGGFVFSISDKGYVGVSNLDIWRYEIQAADTLKVLFTGNTFINLDWENFNSTSQIIAYDIYVNGVKKYATAESEITADNLLPNTSYTFTVIGRDANGNSTPASTPVSVTTSAIISGLKYRYYEGQWNIMPNFNTLTPIKSGNIANTDIITPRNRVDSFGFVWEGYINIPAAGTYTFETTSNDGSQFFFNSFYKPGATALLTNDGTHGTATVSASITVPAAGRYPVAMTFFDRWDAEIMQVYWTGPGIAKQLIPDKAFADPASDAIPPSTPANLKVLYTGKTYVNLDWDNATDNVGVTGYDVYVNDVKTYTTTESAITADKLLPNTSYTFTVKAFDVVGNNSIASNPAIGTTTASSAGLNYRYYQGQWNITPNYNTLTPIKTGSSPNIDIITPRNRDDSFGFVWEGYINIPTAGTYTFETTSNDGSQLYFNSFYNPKDTALLTNDGTQGTQTVSASISVPAAGLYPIAMTFFDRWDAEMMQVYWTGPGITKQLIPNVAFADPSSDVIPPSAPANLHVLYSGKTYVNLDWDTATDNVGVTGYDIYVNNVKTYTTTASAFTADKLLPNTAYTFMVKAFDLIGNNSHESNSVSGSTTAVSSGLNYRYYQGQWDVVPNFNLLTPIKTGSSPNIDIITPRNRDDSFGFVWEGYLNVPMAGTYTFETISNDGSQLYFNSFYNPALTPLLTNDGTHGTQTLTATISIPTAGMYPVAMTFFDKYDAESMQVYWTGPGIPRQLIPTVAFADPNSDAIPPSTPANLHVLYTGKTYVNLDWDNATDNVGVTGYDVYVNNVKTYTTTSSAVTADKLLPGTSYTFSVKAFDLLGNNSSGSASATGTTTTTVTGLNYRYYEALWNIVPNFNALTPIKTGSSPNIDIITPRNREDSFGFVWEGYINIPTAGTYTFETTSNDGSQLYFNSFYNPSATALLTNDGTHGTATVSASISVPTAGLYPIAMTFFDKWDAEIMQVYWSGPGIPKQLIPNSAFTSGNNFPTDTIPPAAPLNFSVIGTNATAIKLYWDNQILRPETTHYDVYVNGAKRYSTDSVIFIADSLLPNTYYSFKAKAINASGIASPFSNEITIRTLFTADGLDYYYYEGTCNSVSDIDKLPLVMQGTTPTVDISIRPVGKDNNFAFRWEGYIKFPTAGTYTFETVSDDGSKLYLTRYFIGATPLVDNDGVHTATSSSGSVFIESPRIRDIAITFFQRDGNQKMEVYWTGPGIPRQIIPKSAFVRYVPIISFFENSIGNVNIIPVTTEPIAKEESGVKMYPNPFDESFQVDFYNASASNKITVGIYDLTGRLVLNRNLGSISAGKNSVNVKLTGNTIVPGIYIVKLHINGKAIKTYKMVKAKR